MHVSIVGAGALGATIGALLGWRGGVDVSFVVRPRRVAETEPFVIESMRGARRHVLAPERAAEVAPDADVILLAVGTEDLDAIGERLGGSEAPIVVLTPMLPRDHAAMRAAFGDRVHAAMPNLLAYRRPEDGVLRYWISPAPTRIDEPRGRSPHREGIQELVRALSRAGLRGHLELGVHERNPATTVSFIAVAMALAVAGSVDALLADDALLDLAARGCREGVQIGRRIGAPDPFAGLAPLVATPWALRVALRTVARVAPEGIVYLDAHFGEKLVAQDVEMAAQIVALAEDKGVPHAAFDALHARLVNVRHHARPGARAPG
jgi:2-dehydropantoate 2-reductase